MTVRLRTSGQWLITLIALGYLVFMFISGRPPTHENLIRAENHGVLALAPEKIVTVVLIRANASQTFERRHNLWQNLAIEKPLTGSETATLEQALSFMHSSTPVRVLRPEEVAGIPGDPYGIENPAIEVRLFTTAGLALTAKFGHTATDGILQYMQISGGAEIYLMSGFVGKTWGRLELLDPAAAR